MSQKPTHDSARLPARESGPADGKPLSPEARLARELIAARRTRDEMFGAALFGEPAWDMLLHLFVAYERGEHVKPAALAEAVPVAPAAAERWLRALEKAGHVVSIGAADRDAGYVYLAGDTARRLRALLEDCR